MDESLGPLIVSRKRGDEQFRAGGESLGFDLLSFWRWITSDLVNNTTRGLVAEYLVARSLGLAVDDTRQEWGAFDLLTPSGIKVEVKSAAYVQTWHQTKVSAITFVVPKTRAWDADTNAQDSVARRQADVYVFALLAHTDKKSIDPLDVNQWEFYVLPTRVLDTRERSQHSLALSSLRSLCQTPIAYTHLASAIEDAARSQNRDPSEPGA